MAAEGEPAGSEGRDAGGGETAAAPDAAVETEGVAFSEADDEQP